MYLSWTDLGSGKNPCSKDQRIKTCAGDFPTSLAISLTVSLPNNPPVPKGLYA